MVDQLNYIQAPDCEVIIPSGEAPIVAERVGSIREVKLLWESLRFV